MSPIRKVDDFRPVEIDSWDEFVQEEIAESMARGEFENLPDQGKPIKIWQTDVNPEYDLAFSRLKNAGVLPRWMELDRQVSDLEASLWHSLDRVETQLRAMIQANRGQAERDEVPIPFWQRIRAWFRTDFTDNDLKPPSMDAIFATRERERRAFLQRAEALDKEITSYHYALPKGGEHLQRLRWLPERAARVFDERITLVAWWDDAQQ